MIAAEKVALQLKRYVFKNTALSVQCLQMHIFFLGGYTIF